MKLIFIFIFVSFAVSEVTNTKYVCTDSLQTIKVNKTDELIFFESNDFPKLYTSQNCLMNFVLENSTTDNIRGTLIISIEISSFGLFFDIFVFENVSSILFDNKRYYFPAFRGYVLFDDCPMESISRVNPFIFTDEAQVIYLQSSYYPNNGNFTFLPRKHPCLWQFSAPSGFGFKFVIEAFNLTSSTQLNIENSTEILLTERNIRVNHAYYNKDNFLKIYLYDKIDYGKYWTIPSSIEFAALISIYINDQKIVDGGCKIITSGSVDTWTNLNDNGYLNNAKCNYDLFIPSGYVVYVREEGQMSLEVFDTVFYYDASKNESDNIDNFYNGKLFYGNKNGKDKIINWTFTSDASIYSVGFSLNFFKYGLFFYSL